MYEENWRKATDDADAALAGRRRDNASRRDETNRRYEERLAEFEARDARCSADADAGQDRWEGATRGMTKDESRQYMYDVRRKMDPGHTAPVLGENPLYDQDAAIRNTRYKSYDQCMGGVTRPRRPS